MITVTIEDKDIEAAIQSHVTQAISEKSSYSNPAKQLAEKQLNHDGPFRDALKAKVNEILLRLKDTPEFDKLVGEQIVKAIAQQHMEELAKKKGY